MKRIFDFSPGRETSAPAPAAPAPCARAPRRGFVAAVPASLAFSQALSVLRPHCVASSAARQKIELSWLKDEAAQLTARRDAELSVDVPKVILDCLSAHVELRCRLRIGIPFRHEHGHVMLTVGQLERGSG